MTKTLLLEGFTSLSHVNAQTITDGDFPTVYSPNSEALERGIVQAIVEDADIVLAPDPDCDLVGVAVKGKGEVETSHRKISQRSVDGLCAVYNGDAQEKRCGEDGRDV